MGVETIKSYLVSLGFTADQPSLAKFEGTMKTAEHVVTSSVGGILGDFLKFQVGATGALAAVGFGVVGFIDKLAMSDQKMRLFAMRSFMTLGQARSITTALEVLGASIEDVSWDRELHDRFLVLIDDQKQLAKMLGPDYEKQMKAVRDIQFQFQRLEVKGEYFGMKVALDLLNKLPLDKILGNLEKLNEYVMENIPQWSEEIATDLVPILQDVWEVMKGLGHLAEDAALEFTNLVGVFSGDTSIQGASFDFHKFATAVEKVTHWMAELVEWMIKAERIAVRFAPVIAGITGGAAAGAPIGAMLGIEGGPLGMLAGGAGGGAIGGILGGVAGLGVMAAEEDGRYGNSGGVKAAAGGEASSVIQEARQLAAEVSRKTSIPADLIFAQWAHETGNFKNRGTTDLNNLAGIRYAGSTEYRKFSSTEDFASFYARLIESRRYTSQGINQAKTPEAFAHALKAGSYYEAPEREYARGMRSFQPEYAGGGASTITIGQINVPITQPGATPQQVQTAVAAGVKAGIDAHQGQQMVELGGAFH